MCRARIVGCGIFYVREVRSVDRIIESLCRGEPLSLEALTCLVENYTPARAMLLAQKAREKREAVYGKDVYIRGLIEISNFCRNDCLYCGIRRSNRQCDRYRLSQEEILAACREGHALGFRTFVLQGGEDAAFTDGHLVNLIRAIKESCPGCAVTLSLGERSYESYRLLREAGADRYLLRHETATPAHYAALHPKEMSFENRMRCLEDLKALGYQVGCGFMVGSPGQTAEHLARDLAFIRDFRPHMCGIGPFIPQKDTPFALETGGTVELTCYLLSIIRLLHPTVLLPATTALGSIHPTGREMGLLAGANVVMPNLSPPAVRKKYAIYDNKLSDGAESARNLTELKEKISAVGYQVVTCRGDQKNS